MFEVYWEPGLKTTLRTTQQNTTQWETPQKADEHLFEWA